MLLCTVVWLMLSHVLIVLIIILNRQFSAKVALVNLFLKNDYQYTASLWNKRCGTTCEIPVYTGCSCKNPLQNDQLSFCRDTWHTTRSKNGVRTALLSNCDQLWKMESGPAQHSCAYSLNENGIFGTHTHTHTKQKQTKNSC